MPKTKAKPVVPIKPWTEIIADYRSRQDRRGHSDLTKIKYDQIIGDYFETLGRKNPSRDNITAFLNSLILDGRHVELTVNKNQTVISTFFTWCKTQRLIKFNPCTSLKLRKVEKRLPVVLREAQMNDLYRDAEKNNLVSVQDLVMLDTFYGTLMRTAELCSVKISDINLTKREIKIRGGKGNKDRIVAIPKQTATELKKYLHGLLIKHPTCEYAFPSSRGKRMNPGYVYQRISRILYKIVDKKKGAHTLRHTGATVMLDRGAPLEGIKEQLGHASLDSTQVYTHTSITRLKNVHALAHPKA